MGTEAMQVLAAIDLDKQTRPPTSAHQFQLRRGHGGPVLRGAKGQKRSANGNGSQKQQRQAKPNVCQFVIHVLGPRTLVSKGFYVSNSCDIMTHNDPTHNLTQDHIRSNFILQEMASEIFQRLDNPI